MMGSHKPEVRQLFVNSFHQGFIQCDLQKYLYRSHTANSLNSIIKSSFLFDVIERRTCQCALHMFL